jgi:hypothetical protein
LTKKLLDKGLPLKNPPVDLVKLQEQFFATVGTTEAFKALSMDEKEASLEAYMKEQQ